MRGCVCFSDEELLLFMRRLFKLFLKGIFLSFSEFFDFFLNFFFCFLLGFFLIIIFDPLLPNSFSLLFVSFSFCLSLFLLSPVTRYPRKDMEGLEIECHYSNAKQTFATFPNTHRFSLFLSLFLSLFSFFLLLFLISLSLFSFSLFLSFSLFSHSNNTLNRDFVFANLAPPVALN